MQNKVARALFIIGVITIIVGGGFGIILLFQDITGFMFLISAVVSGVFVIGFSEVIHLLDQIHRKLNERN